MRSPRLAMCALAGALLVSGCSAVIALPVEPAADSSRDVKVSSAFTLPPGKAVTYNDALVRVGAVAAVSSSSRAGATTVTLAVRGLVPKRAYGAHVHAKQCGPKPEDSGPHFQFSPDPVSPSVDPAYANPQNEIWLDFTTDDEGSATKEASVAWEFPADRRGQSLVIHETATATHAGHAGTAGSRLACLNVEF